MGEVGKGAENLIRNLPKAVGLGLEEVTGVRAAKTAQTQAAEELREVEVEAETERADELETRRRAAVEASRAAQSTRDVGTRPRRLANVATQKLGADELEFLGL